MSRRLLISFSSNDRFLNLLWFKGSLSLRIQGRFFCRHKIHPTPVMPRGRGRAPFAAAAAAERKEELKKGDFHPEKSER